MQLIRKEQTVIFEYTPTGHNPADLPSRGRVPAAENENLWWHGPDWLYSTTMATPFSTSVASPGEKTSGSSGSDHPIECEAHVVQEEALPLGPFDLDPTKFSSLTRMVRVTSWAKRFIDNTRNRERVSLPYLTAEELRTARDQCIQYAQRTAYQDIIGCIKKGKSNDMISKLQLFLDDNNLIRCNARLQYSDLLDSTKYPILLPRSHPITSLIIRHNHLNLLHSGASNTLSRVRQTFWIPAGRRAVKAEFAKCLVCQRTEGGPFATPKMAPLPSERVNPAISFTNCGVDYFGSLYVKGVKENKKVWVALYTCLVTQAVHLGIVNDMSTEQFVLSFRRFVSRRGCPERIWSDNAPHFKQSNKALQLAWKDIVVDVDV